MGDRGVPKWLRYSKLGKPLIDTFICFKVPFKSSLNQNLQENQRFYLYEVFDKVPNLGLVIDLTKTTRYYDSKEVIDKNIEYHKIIMEGMGTIPPRSQVDQFIDVVDNFRRSVNESGSKKNLIGVHCTHGCNRTGYMVCKYLIERMHMRPEDALKAFAAARGHELERESYRKDILKTVVEENQGKNQGVDKDGTSDVISNAVVKSKVIPATSVPQELPKNDHPQAQGFDGHKSSANNDVRRHTPYFRTRSRSRSPGTRNYSYNHYYHPDSRASYNTRRPGREARSLWIHDYHSPHSRNSFQRNSNPYPEAPRRGYHRDSYRSYQSDWNRRRHY